MFIFIISAIFTIVLINITVSFLSNRYQKKICIEKFCIEKPKDWVVTLTKRKNKLYLFDLLSVDSALFDDDSLELHSNGIVLRKKLAKMVFYTYKGDEKPNHALFNETIFPKYEINDSIYHMMYMSDDNVFIIYPKNRFGFDIDDYPFDQEFIEDILGKSTSIETSKYFLKQKIVKKIVLSKEVALGLKYHKGTERAIDYTKAMYYFNQGAKNADSVAQFMLGLMYENGDGVKVDNKKAFYFYKQSAKQGYILALHNLSLMYRQGKGVKKSYYNAVSLLQKPVYYGLTVSQIQLAMQYQYGQGVVQNYKKAYSLYEKALNKGSFIALNNLGTMYYLGQGVNVDKVKACEYWHNTVKGGKAAIHDMAKENIEKFCP